MNGVKKPQILMLLQGVLVLLALSNTIALVLDVLAITRGTLGDSPTMMVLRVLAVAIFIAAVKGVNDRKPYGRIVGTTSFIYLACLTVAGIFWYFYYPGSNVLSLPFLALMAVQIGLYLLAACVFALSPKIDAYFRPEKYSGELTPPPPPDFSE
jgi:hypothetical protein